MAGSILIVDDEKNILATLSRALEIEGYAILRCKVAPNGTLESCTASSERPPELGFAAAAVALAPRFRMRPRTVDGLAVTGEINIPIRFQLPTPEPYADPAAAGSPKALSLARRLVTLEKLTHKVLDGYEEAAAKIEFTTDDDVPDATRTAAAKAVREAAGAHAADLAEAFAHIYAGLLTEAELADLVAFGESVAGHTMVGDNPDLSAILTMIGRDQDKAVQARARIEFCKLRPCTRDGDLGLAKDVASGLVAIGQPTWAASPTDDDLYGATPRLAWSLGIGARARLRCVVAAQGVLHNCKVAAEAPAGLGAGAAALSLAPLYRLDTAALAGGALGKTVALSIDFPAPEAPEAYAPPPAKSPRALALARALMNDDDTHAADMAQAATDLRAATTKIFAAADPATREAGMAAMLKAGEAVKREQQEQVASAYAALMTEEQLAAGIAFRQGPTFRSRQAKAPAMAKAAAAAQEHFAEVIATDAGAIYCKTRPCEAARKAQPSPASSAPSTRTP